MKCTDNLAVGRQSNVFRAQNIQMVIKYNICLYKMRF